MLSHCRTLPCKLFIVWYISWSINRSRYDVSIISFIFVVPRNLFRQRKFCLIRMRAVPESVECLLIQNVIVKRQKNMFWKNMKVYVKQVNWLLNQLMIDTGRWMAIVSCMNVIKRNTVICISNNSTGYFKKWIWQIQNRLFLIYSLQT